MVVLLTTHQRFKDGERGNRKGKGKGRDGFFGLKKERLKNFYILYRVKIIFK